jgi:hypothetical protein
MRPGHVTQVKRVPEWVQPHRDPQSLDRFPGSSARRASVALCKTRIIAIRVEAGCDVGFRDAFGMVPGSRERYCQCRMRHRIGRVERDGAPRAFDGTRHIFGSQIRP